MVFKGGKNLFFKSGLILRIFFYQKKKWNVFYESPKSVDIVCAVIVVLIVIAIHNKIVNELIFIGYFYYRFKVKFLLCKPHIEAAISYFS